MIPSGPRDAKIAIIGEAPGLDEERTGKPFVGISGRELDQMLSEAGIARRDCFTTNCVSDRPPGNDIEHFFHTKKDAKALGISPLNGRFPKENLRRGVEELWSTLNDIRPNVIIAVGDTPLWALSGEQGITKWRGSVLPTPFGKLIPTYHPAYILRQWNFRPIAVTDLRRAARESRTPDLVVPDWKFEIRPSYEAAVERLEWLLTLPPQLIVCDLETRANQIACVGIAWSKLDAFCLPLMCVTGDGSFYPQDQEHVLLSLLKRVLQHHDICFHNGNFDCQYIARQWGFLPNFRHDTMLMQHLCFPGLLGGKIDPVTGKVSKKGSSLSLSFISSMYCEHYRFWKDDGRTWDESINEDVFWTYCNEDCVRTFECAETLLSMIKKMGFEKQYRDKMDLFELTFDVMFRGLRVDTDMQRRFMRKLTADEKEIQEWLNTAAGHTFNPSSNPQMLKFFYSDLKMEVVKDRKTKQPTTSDVALEKFKARSPLIRPFIERMQILRSIGVYKSNYLDTVMSPDGRLRGSFNVVGPETFRLSANKNAFGEGLNLQTIPREGD
jgi:uracil-DNA glycosylase